MYGISAIGILCVVDALLRNEAFFEREHQLGPLFTPRLRPLCFSICRAALAAASCRSSFLESYLPLVNSIVDEWIEKEVLNAEEASSLEDLCFRELPKPFDPNAPLPSLCVSVSQMQKIPRRIFRISSFFDSDLPHLMPSVDDPSSFLTAGAVLSKDPLWMIRYPSGEPSPPDRQLWVFSLDDLVAPFLRAIEGSLGDEAEEEAKKVQRFITFLSHLCQNEYGISEEINASCVVPGILDLSFGGNVVESTVQTEHGDIRHLLARIALFYSQGRQFSLEPILFEEYAILPQISEAIDRLDRSTGGWLQETRRLFQTLVNRPRPKCIVSIVSSKSLVWSFLCLMVFGYSNFIEACNVLSAQEVGTSKCLKSLRIRYRSAYHESKGENSNLGNGIGSTQVLAVGTPNLMEKPALDCRIPFLEVASIDDLRQLTDATDNGYL